MLTRLTIYLSLEEVKAIQVVAGKEMRGIKDQVRYFVRAELIQRGMIRDEVSLAGLIDQHKGRRHVREQCDNNE